MNIKPRICERCGKTYTPRGTVQKFCPECQPIQQAIVKKRYEMKKYPNRKPKQKRTDVCCVCGEPFACSFDGKPYCNKHYLRMYLNGSPELKPRVSKNSFYVQSEITIGQTTKGRIFIFNTSDLEKVKKHTWCFDSRGYLVANINDKVVGLHRYLLDAPKGSVVDHINGDTADNRRANLRICDRKGNSRNTSKSKSNKAGALGVSFTAGGKYRARIMVDGKEIRLGNFDTIEEAVAARIEGEKKYYGEFSPSLSRL